MPGETIAVASIDKEPKKGGRRKRRKARRQPEEKKKNTESYLEKGESFMGRRGGSPRGGSAKKKGKIALQEGKKWTHGREGESTVRGREGDRGRLAARERAFLRKGYASWV